MSNCYATQLHFYITNHCIYVNICVPVYFVYEFNKINKANWANLISAIKQIDWSTVLDPTASTTCLIPFTDIISQICSLHTPVKGTKKAKKVSVFIENGRS